MILIECIFVAKGSFSRAYKYFIGYFFSWKYCWSNNFVLYTDIMVIDFYNIINMSKWYIDEFNFLNISFILSLYSIWESMYLIIFFSDKIKRLIMYFRAGRDLERLANLPFVHVWRRQSDNVKRTTATKNNKKYFGRCNKTKFLCFKELRSVF